MEIIDYLDLVQKVVLIIAGVATTASVVHNWNK